MVPPTEAGSTAERTEQEGRHGFVQTAALTPLNDDAEKVLGQTAGAAWKVPALKHRVENAEKGRLTLHRRLRFSFPRWRAYLGKMTMRWTE